MGTDQAAPAYQQTFSVPRRAQDPRSAQEWLRAMFERAPAPLRLLLVAGWRLGLGLRLGPLSSPDHVLGWPITENRHARVRLEVGSWAVHAAMTLSLGETQGHLDSTVAPRNLAGRALWAAALPLHRLIVPLALRRASRLD